MSTVLHPELVQSVPLISGIAERALEQRAQDTLVQDPALDQPLTVVIRARNEAATLEPLLQDIAGQQTREVEVVVVDNESTDRTREVAREYGATVVTIARGDFTYPRSMNVGTEAASHDLVFLTVGHALLSTSLSLHAGVRHFQPDSNVAGVFSFSLPSATASRTDRLLDGAASLELLRGPYDVKKARMAVLAATGAMISKAVWEELGRFDERYESGGEGRGYRAGAADARAGL